MVDWLDLSSTGTTPAGTTVQFATRSGNTPTPDGNWSGWAAVNSPINSPNGRYLQYRATLTSIQPPYLITPILENVTITYQLSPTAATVSSFTAEPHLNTILLSWQTAIEVELLGFNLYRSDNPNDPLNAKLILANAPGSLTGTAYEFADRNVEPGEIYEYVLEYITISGSNRLTPIVATAPYAVYLPFLRP